MVLIFAYFAENEESAKIRPSEIKNKAFYENQRKDKIYSCEKARKLEPRECRFCQTVEKRTTRKRALQYIFFFRFSQQLRPAIVPLYFHSTNITRIKMSAKGNLYSGTVAPEGPKSRLFRRELFFYLKGAITLPYKGPFWSFFCPHGHFFSTGGTFEQ